MTTTKTLPKYFNTAGPIQPDIHYTVEPLSRIDMEEVEQLIYQRKYFTLHAPRQTGKTSCLLALRDYLNARGEFIAVYANVEAGQAARNDVARVVEATASSITSRLSLILGNKMPQELLNTIRQQEAADSLLTAYLRALSEALPRPLILFIDEIDALVGDSLVSVLRQIRAGYDQRPANFPQTIILCGVRDNPLRIANAIYKEVIPRELTWARQQTLTQQSAWYIRPDGSIDMQKLLLDFQQFFRQNADSWIEKFDYKESGPQLLLQAFLQRVVNGGGYIDRPWDEKLWHYQREYNGREIEVWGM